MQNDSAKQKAKEERLERKKKQKADKDKKKHQDSVMYAINPNKHPMVQAMRLAKAQAPNQGS